jgi:hypothetical protein
MAQSVLEKKVEKLLTDMLDRNEIFHIKGNPIGLKGFPDRLIFAHELYFVEVKVGKELGSYYKQTKMQKFWQKKIEESNANYRLLTGFKEVRAFMEFLKKESL